MSTSESLCRAYPYCTWEAPGGAGASSGACATKVGFEAFALYCGSTDQQSCETFGAFCEWKELASPPIIAPDPPISAPDPPAPPTPGYSGAMSQGDDKFCTGNEGLILLTDTKVDIMESSGAITSCATGLFSAVNAIMDPDGGIYVVEDMGQTVKYIAPDCGSITEVLNSGNGLVRPSAVAYIPNSATGGYNLAVSNSQGTTGYLFEFDSSGNNIGRSPLNAPGGLSYVSFDGETLSGVSGNKIFGTFDETFTFVASNDISSIVDMRQVSLGCDGKTYIAADDNNDIFECDDINDPSTCEPLCPIESGVGVTNPWAVGIGTDCSVYTASRGPEAGNIYKYDSATCFVPVKIGKLPNGGEGIKSIIPFMESVGECKGIQYVCPENCEDPVPTCNNEVSNVECDPASEDPVLDWETKPCEPAITDCQAECCLPWPVCADRVTCDDSTHYNDPDGSCSRDEDDAVCETTCCIPKPKCKNEHNCYDGTKTNNDYCGYPGSPIGDCNQENCCVAETCEEQKHDCGIEEEDDNYNSVTCDPGKEDCQAICCNPRTCADMAIDCAGQNLFNDYRNRLCGVGDSPGDDCFTVCCTPKQSCENDYTCQPEDRTVGATECSNKLQSGDDNKCDDDLCCVARTCGSENHVCAGDTRLVSGSNSIECAGNTQCQSRCCEDKPTCSSEGHDCSTGTQRKPNYNNIFCEGADCQSKCCEDIPTCGSVNHVCAGDSRLVSGSDSIECSGNTECQSKCCEDKPTCSSEGHDCSTGTQRKPNYNNIFCEGADCQSKCCEDKPTCGSVNHVCAGDTRLVSGSNSIECSGNTECQSKCCEDKPTCSSEGHNCATGTQRKPNYNNIFCEGADCQSKCCEDQPTCGSENYSCSDGTERKPGSDNILCSGADCQNKCCQSACDAQCDGKTNGTPCDGGNGDSKQCINCQCIPTTCVDTSECTDFHLDYAIRSNGYIRGTAPRKQTFTYEGQSFDIDFSGIFTDENGANSNVQPIIFDTHLPVGCCNQNGQNLEDLAKDSSFTCNLGGCSCQVSDICGNGDIDLIVGEQRRNTGIYKSSDTCRNDQIDRPFAGYGNGNANDATRDPRYVLVIPEHPFKSRDGCFAPDDNRYGGYIELDFSDPMEKGLDFVLMGSVKLLDIEDASEGDTKATLYRQ
eukprot:Awhi_evm1s12736